MAHPSAPEILEGAEEELKITASLPFLSLRVKYEDCARLVEQARGPD